MSDSDSTATPFLNGPYGPYGPDAPPGPYGFPADDDTASPGTAPVSWAMLRAAIRRGALFCCVMAIAGLVIGSALFVAFPAPYQASTTILLTDGPYENGLSSAGDDQAFAQTNTVAEAAMHDLGLSGSVSGFVPKYTITVASQRVLVVTFSAASSGQAMAGANAVAAALLKFRAGLLQQEQQQVLAALGRQVSQDKQQIRSLTAQIRQTQPASPARKSLQAQLTSATTALGNVQGILTTDLATSGPATVAAIKGSRVLYGATPLPRSHVKRILYFPVAGLVLGLAIGLGIVMIRAMVSDRPRRRDDVASALGAPVRISTGPLRRTRRLSAFRRGSAAARQADIERIAAHLARVVPAQRGGAAGLAVVAVDDPEAAALPLVSLAISCARQGKRVVLADLAGGAPAARLLRAGSGVGTVDTQGVRLVTAVPAPDDPAPSGPLGQAPAADRDSALRSKVVTACAQADLLLTLVTLDPSFGGDHLPTWATHVVVVTTAGRSTWTRISAVGEMIRLSGTRMASAVLVGADRTDESLGAISEQRASYDDEVMQKALRAERNGALLAANDGAGRQHG